MERLGITFQSKQNNTEQQIQGTIASISADNLGAHDLAGFSKCFSSGRICRYCMCHYNEMKEKHNPLDFVLRTPFNHNIHLNAIRMDHTLQSVYGVTSSCPFSELCGFSPAISFPPDIMHDCLEGVIPYFLQHLVNSLAISISDVNQKLKSFCFGSADQKNAPKSVNSNVFHLNGKISASASEARCVFRLLPFVIGDEVSSSNNAWKLYLLLCDIFDIILAPKIDSSDLNYLSVLLSSFLSSFSKFSPELYKPKFHFLMHYPRMIKMYGPFRNVWCMRFESFHQKIKKIVKNTQNFVNLDLTVASRLQGGKCYEQYKMSCLKDEDEFFGSKSACLSSFSADVSSFLENNFQFADDELFTMSGMLVNGVSYKLNFVYVLEILNHDIPVFGLVKQIILCGSTVVIVCAFLETMNFDAHKHAYVVKITDQILFLQPGCELNIHPLNMYRINGKNYVRMHYNIFNDSAE